MTHVRRYLNEEQTKRVVAEMRVSPLSPSQISQITGICYSAFKNWESGRVTRMHVNYAAAIRKALS